MIYSFDFDFAKEFGVEEAIMITNFQFWISKNKAAGVNFHEGRTWTYNSAKAFAALFPFWTTKQVRRILDSLITKKVLMTGRYNTRTNNRTIWYAFVNEERFLPLNGPAQVADPLQIEQMAALAEQTEIPEQLQEEAEQMSQGFRPDPEREQTDPNKRILAYDKLPDTEKTIINQVISEWNIGILIPADNPPAARMIRKIQKAFKKYPAAKIIKAIRNYAEIIGSPEKYWYTYQWDLDDFLNRGIYKFFDEAYPLKRFLSGQMKNRTNHFTDESNFDKERIQPPRQP